MGDPWILPISYPVKLPQGGSGQGHCAKALRGNTRGQ